VPELLWDASALVKRYAPETGSDVADAIFVAGTGVPMVAAYLVYAETCATLRRKRNGGNIDARSFQAARRLVRHELFVAPGFHLLSVDDQAVLGGIALADRHNLNASDAAILYVYLGYVRSRVTAGVPCCLVSADYRFVRAATAEGLRTANPERLAFTDVPAFIASL
jgi:predicted nucleic acid-binding protein